MICTTAGLAFDATAIVADDSSIVTGWLLAPTVVPVVLVEVGVVSSSAPVALSAKTVPPDARTADSRAAPTTVPTPDRPDLVEVTGVDATGAAGIVAAGSYQRSGVGWAGTVVSWRAQSGRASAGGE